VIRIPVVLEFSPQRISDLVVSAVEGGSNYWSHIKIFDGQGNRLRGLDAAGPNGCCGKCRVVFKDLQDQSYYGELNLLSEGKMENVAGGGLTRMAGKYPTHFADFLAENDDATTADVFVQCCIFGEVRYG